MNKNVWALKSVLEKDKSSLTIESYEDNITEYYNYDNYVQNSQQIHSDDLAIIVDKEKILGFAKIGNIDSRKGTKMVRRCPFCSSTSITIRSKKLPIYRCNKKHEFNSTIDETRDVTKYKATFTSFIHITEEPKDLKQLRPYYSNGYNQNLSMQRLDYETLHLFENIQKKLNSNTSNFFLEDNVSTEIEYDYYFPHSNDEREYALRAIKARRGQREFRKKLLSIYQNRCAITDCNIIDILEAAHINPYRGVKDNHEANGLLLRADIHTLFDLDLIAVNPESFEVEISTRLRNSEYVILNKKKLKNEVIKSISTEALNIKWKLFNK